MNLFDLIELQNRNNTKNNRDGYDPEISSNTLDTLWNSSVHNEWLQIEQTKYWNLIKDSNLDIEREFENLDAVAISRMNVQEFYTFLYEKYFVWKYTAANRLATTRMHLQKHQNNLGELEKIHNNLFSFDKKDIMAGLIIASQIKGLGTAGASGLLSVLFPEFFGTVDQFVVSAFLNIHNLDYSNQIQRINPQNIKPSEGVILIELMREKAHQLNKKNNTNYWTPRKIDKVLWAYRL